MTKLEAYKIAEQISNNTSLTNSQKARQIAYIADRVDKRKYIECKVLND